MNFNFHSYTIEKEGNIFVVFGHGEYPAESVLCGQIARIRLGEFDTLERAGWAYPLASVCKHSTRIPSGWMSGSDLAPSWFDPADAGERWDDDY